MTEPTEPSEPIEPSAEGASHEVALEQRRHLRRILVTFFIVVVLMPLAGIGGAWSLLLLPLLAVAAAGFREAIALRRSVNAHGPMRP